MLIRSFLCVAVVLGMVRVSSADPILDVELQYVTSWDAMWGDLGMGATTQTVLPDGTTRTDVTLLPGAAYHQFGLYVTITGLAADQDLVFQQYRAITGGGATLNFAAPGDPRAGAFALDNPVIDPPLMGSPASSAPPATRFSDLSVFNLLSDTYGGFVLDVRRGSTVPGTPSTGNKYGDYAAYISGTGFGGLGETLHYIGDLYMLDSAPGGTLGFLFPGNSVGGKCKIISGNIAGMAAGAAAESYPLGYAGKGDSVYFVPEPSTLVLLGMGAIGLLAWAWRRRRA